MNYVSVTYSYNYQLDFAPEYKYTICKKCINAKTNRQIKQVRVGGSIGYNIKGKFYSLTKLRKHLVKPEVIKLPF
jgi:hypothetical protein|tara:strand:- start:370 stop:594 length:225 start_codon:yes stop_codon:yes gene_type:complete